MEDPVPNFETFTKRMVPLTKAPTVTVQKNKGIMSLNKAAHVALGEPSAVELMYDQADEIIGIRGVSEEVPHAYPVRSVGKEATTFVVAGTAFTKYYGINTDESRRYAAEIQDGVLCVNLRGDSVVVSNTRRSRGSGAEDASADV